jgi:tRNA(Arg) A34 adenosine deaminase TadA
MCAGACVWSKIGAVVFGVSQEDITAYGKKYGTEEFKWRRLSHFVQICS